jgi:cation diffusion facilitator CzcD-associated flavoprotein CzcO
MNASLETAPRGLEQLPTCCIIGAGICGLTTAKALLDRGVPFDWFELSDRIGGVWAFNNPNGRSAAYRSLHIDSSKSRISFEDFPVPADWPEYPHHLQIAEYLKSYAKHFNLTDKITFSTEVVRVARAADGTWSVTLSSGETRAYGAVAVCNGHHWDPRWPTPAYPGIFTGEQMHAASYIDPFTPIDMRGKTVLVVGMGNSAMDISSELSPRHISAKLIVSARRGVYIFPRFMLGRAADKGKVYRWLPMSLQTAVSKWIYRRVVGRMEDYGLPKPDHELFESHGTVSDEFPSRAAAGDIQIRPALAKLDGDGVIFANGRREQVDVIVWATGYNVSLPFFDKELLAVEDNRLPLFRRMFKPGMDGLIFIGLLQSTVTIFTIAEKQARLAAAYLAGEYALPDVNAMERIIVEDEARHNGRYYASARHTMQVDQEVYYWDLERETKEGMKRARCRRVA